MRPHSIAAVMPLLLAAALLLSPLAAGYVWAEGRHADEGQLQRHRFLMHLAPNSYHHPVSPVTWEEFQGLEERGQGPTTIVLGTAATMVAPVISAAAPSIVSPLDGTSALPAATMASVILYSLLVLLWMHFLRPQNQPYPLGKPPSTTP